MGYTDAIEEQMGTQDLMNQSRVADAILQALAASTAKASKDVADADLAMAWIGMNQAIAMGEPYYMSAAISDMILRASAGMDDWTWTPDMLPSAHGFVYLEKPVPMPRMATRNGEWIDMPMVSFAWTIGMQRIRENDGLGMMLAPATEHDLLKQELSPNEARYAVLVYNVKRDAYAYALPSGTEMFMMGANVKDVWAESGIEPDDPMTAAPRFIAAFLFFIRQTLLTYTRERASRAVRRRLEVSRPNWQPEVRVVTLRKHKYMERDREGNPIEWSCQWLVRGHWRQQRWGPKRQYVRPVWIMPYIKGPEDKPLKATDERLFAVVR